MDKKYTVAENTQILIGLLKAYGVKKIIASPGTMNLNFIGSVQHDPFFEIYSVVDERSAAYMACGMAAESGEAVVLSCTGATASRNYIPGLTEAYYRKLPVIAVTATQPQMNIGHNMEQVIDRRAQLNDMVVESVQLPIIHDANERWNCTIQVNKALIATKRHGGGPVHINLEVTNLKDFSVEELPQVRKIEYFCGLEDRLRFPEIHQEKVAVFVGAHTKMEPKLQDAITAFCEKYNGVVLCDQTSNYFGKYRIVPSLMIKQDAFTADCTKIDLLIHIGDVSGSQFKLDAKEVWRVNPDGEIRDTFKRLKCVFEMQEKTFFECYSQGEYEEKDSFFHQWKAEQEMFCTLIPELPFSNLWVAQNTIEKLPEDVVIHMGILNSLRSWNYFDTDKCLEGYSNTGGFGIDGGISSLIGGALVNKEKLHFGFFGDLAFFYDLNSLGNRHVPDNIRILLLNNGKGVEFRKYNHPANRFGEEADLYMAAAGHNGNRSCDLVKHFAQDLGFSYLCASSKEEYFAQIDKFVSPQFMDCPMIMEIFVEPEDDSTALYTVNNLKSDLKGTAKNITKNILGDKGIKLAEKIIKK